ncbi:TetR/AcrR family transcriptional regulator [Streptomyces sp. G45]|uniref:TetR/AcrR family transcriptional regulator n=1 Tax=Streptomyces sp. G45 TaxID=3406627 RepID=UPI003C16EDCE
MSSVNEDDPPRPGRPRSAGVDRAVGRATLELLAETGYAGLRMDAVAARAGVGKAALYRRWPSKAALVLRHLVADLAPRTPVDTGGLRGDLRVLARDTVTRMTHPRVRPVLPELLTELVRDPALQQVFADACLIPERDAVRAVAERAVARGKLRRAPDVEWAHAQLTGPVFVWLHLLRERADEATADRLADDVAAAWLAREGRQAPQGRANGRAERAEAEATAETEGDAR